MRKHPMSDTGYDSMDGTLDEIEKLNLETQIIHGGGSLYWCGGTALSVPMRMTFI